MEKLPPLVWGYRWNTNIMEAARSSKKLLRAAVAIKGGDSPECNLRCIFCFTKGGEIVPGVRKISNEEVVNFLKDCSEFAFDKNEMSYFLVSDAEPSLNKGLGDVIKIIKDLKGKITIFTNLFSLPDELTDLYLDTKNLFVCGKKYGVTASTNDYLTGVSGSYEVMERNIKKLVDAGLADEGRLGVQCVATTANREEILDLFKWGRTHKIIPHIMMYREQGRGINHRELALTEKELLDIFKKCAEYDLKQYGYKWTPSLPMLGIDKCYIPGVNLYLKSNGNVDVCAGDTRILGDYRKESVSEIINSPLFDELRTNFKGCKWATELHERSKFREL
jgi:MoaA/NifB/PqqE/SkfB family radical SAM enzyme